MFQLISIIGFVGVAAFIILHYMTTSDRGEISSQTPSESKRGDELSARDLTPFGHVKRLSLAVIVVCFVVLTLTGFIPPLLFEELLSGFPLVLHVGLAPVFIVCVVFAVFAWAYQCQLDGADWQRLKGLLSFQGEPSRRSTLGCKLTFWTGALLVIPVSLSIVAGMFPIFGTHGQEALIEIHKYTSLFLVLVAVLHVYFLVRHRFVAPLGNVIAGDALPPRSGQPGDKASPESARAQTTKPVSQARRRRPQQGSGAEKRPSRRRPPTRVKRAAPKRSRTSAH